MKTRFGAILLAVILAVAPLPGSAEPPKVDTLARLSFGSGWDALPAVVGIERGFFAQQGLVVSPLTVTSGEAVMQSLASGSTDFAVLPQRAFLLMVAARLPVRAVAVSGWGTRVELVVSPGLANAKSIADLKGKKIAVNKGSDALPALLRLAKQAKLKPTDLLLLQLPAEEMVQVFKEKKADAVFATAHFTEPLVSHSGARRLLSNEEIVQATGFVGTQPLVVSRKTIERDPAMVQKFVDGWVKAVAYTEQDPEDAARLLQVFFHRLGVAATPEQAASWVGMTRHDRAVWTKQDTADVVANGASLADGGIFKVRPKLDGYVDTSYAK
jgi:ABC-type nitrate/sulfonate/bicarbonate transport system substrate-binding protein